MRKRADRALRAGGRARWSAAGRASFAARLGGAIGVVVLALALPLLTAGAAGADGRPPGGRLNDPTVRKVDIAEPALVRIVLLFNARITLTLCGQDITLPKSYPVGGIGTGAFISANGDILTADHMVAANGADIVGNPDADTDIANLLDNNPTCHLRTPITATDVANGFLDTAGIAYQTQVSQVQHLVWQGTPFSGQVDTTSSQSILDALSHVPHLDGTVEAESSLSENDLAILHVNLTDTPSVKLDDSSQVAVDDQLTILGYPGNGDQFRAVSDQTVDANDLLTPSVNNVTVSSIKSNSNGARLIQVGGNVEHGDSGGPALDASGNIVGIVSFGTSDGSAQTVGNTSFLRSSDDVQPLLTQANINTTPGTFEKQWEQAFNDYAATAPGHWHVAARELDALATAYPDFKGIQQYKDYADNAAAVEQVPADDSLVLAILLAIVVLALISAIVLFVVILRQRSRSRQVAAQAAMGGQGAVFGAYGPPSQYGIYGPPSQYGGYAPPSQFGAYGPPQYGAYGPPSQFGGYAAPSQYGGSAQPSQYGTVPPPTVASPTIPYTNPDALPAPTDRPAWPGASVATATYGDLPDAPSGRMVLPERSDPEYGADRTAVQARGVCVNGHGMPPGEVYCAMCGAPRSSSAPS